MLWYRSVPFHCLASYVSCQWLEENTRSHATWEYWPFHRPADNRLILLYSSPWVILILTVQAGKDISTEFEEKATDSKHPGNLREGRGKCIHLRVERTVGQWPAWDRLHKWLRMNPWEEGREGRKGEGEKSTGKLTERREENGDRRRSTVEGREGK